MPAAAGTRMMLATEVLEVLRRRNPGEAATRCELLLLLQTAASPATGCRKHCAAQLLRHSVLCCTVLCCAALCCAAVPASLCGCPCVVSTSCWLHCVHLSACLRVPNPAARRPMLLPSHLPACLLQNARQPDQEGWGREGLQSIPARNRQRRTGCCLLPGRAPAAELAAATRGREVRSSRAWPGPARPGLAWSRAC